MTDREILLQMFRRNGIPVRFNQEGTAVDDGWGPIYVSEEDTKQGYSHFYTVFGFDNDKHDSLVEVAAYE